MKALSTHTLGRQGVIDAILAVVADDGLERATVRQVASVAGVAIGTVQHWFPSKDALLRGAFEAVVDRIRARVDALEFGPDTRENLRTAMAELLPLDAGRRRETRVQLAFAARAAVEPDLARLQRAVLDDVRSSFAEGFSLALARPADDPVCAANAWAALALVDGLALHAVSGRLRSPDAPLLAAVDTFLDAALAGSAQD